MTKWWESCKTYSVSKPKRVCFSWRRKDVGKFSSCEKRRVETISPLHASGRGWNIKHLLNKRSWKHSSIATTEMKRWDQSVKMSYNIYWTKFKTCWNKPTQIGRFEPNPSNKHSEPWGLGGKMVWRGARENADVPRLSIGGTTLEQVVTGSHFGAEISGSNTEDIQKGKVGRRKGGRQL